MVGTEPTVTEMFSVMNGWTTGYTVDGIRIGGPNDALPQDERLRWHLGVVGGAAGKRILELGPLEGHHTKMMIEAGAREVIAVEGLSDCWMRCLIVKEAFRLDRARFLFGDFRRYVSDYVGEPFDIVSAAGMLYHLNNPADLIHDLAKLTNNVMVWSHVVGRGLPSNIEATIESRGRTYKGRIQNYGGSRDTSESYCGGLADTSFWMYPDDMQRCFNDAGFSKITGRACATSPHGDALLFVAQK